VAEDRGQRNQQGVTAPNLSVLRGPIPFPFEANQGQADADIAYILRAGSMHVGFGHGGQRFQLTDRERCEDAALRNPADRYREVTPCINGTPVQTFSHRIASELVGAEGVMPVGLVPSETTLSYFRGQPDEWLVGVPAFYQVSYPNAWPGIEVRYERAPTGLEASYVLAPGADPSQIRIAWHGVDGGRLTEAGVLEMTTPIGTLRESAPIAWQDTLWGRQTVSARFELVNDGAAGDPVEVGFRLGTYDPGRPLVIDPSFVFSGYLGGNSGDIGYAIAVDSNGNAYVTGDTQCGQPGFPALVGPDLSCNNVDAFVVKVTQDGTGLVYAGFIGGDNPETGYGIAVDGAGNAYVTGNTTSSVALHFPLVVGPQLTDNGSANAFVAKVNPAGTGLVYSGFIGGNGNEVGYGIAVDSAGSAYVTGYVIFSGTNFPIVVGPAANFNDTDVFISKVKADGSGFAYSAIFGGGPNNQDIGYGVAVDSAGRAYITGTTASSPANGFPATVGPDLTLSTNRDAFVARVRADGTGFEYAGYIGGEGEDFGRGITVDSTGAAYVVGDTTSDQTSFPVLIGPALTRRAGSDAFVTKVKPDGTGLLYSGFIGGDGSESGTGLAIDAAGNAYIVGTTNSGPTTFPLKDGPDLTPNGSFDAFVAKVRADATGLEYAGYIGSTDIDNGNGIAVDSVGNAYVTGHVNGNDASFTTLIGPDTSPNGSIDAFVAKIDNVTATPTSTPTPTPTLTPTVTLTPTSTPTPVVTACQPRPAVQLTTVPGSLGVLNVTVRAGRGTISRIDFGADNPRIRNAQVSVAGGPVNQTQPFPFVPPAGQTTVQISILSPDRSHDTSVQFDVYDECGRWPTFVGGGAGSF